MKTYHVQTYGCQMNKHDSERVSGMLEEMGLTPVEDFAHADVVVFMTCCVREKADVRLKGVVSSLKYRKDANPSMIIAVGGCIGQRDGQKLIDQIGHIDVVFGTQNVADLPSLIEAAYESKAPQVSIKEASEDFASDLPTHRESPFHAWLPITVGCDNFCTYCVVPYVRGRERSRKIEDIVAEAEKLVADGVKEITLLGQNVNSYGRDLYGEPRFAEVLRQVAATGIKRLGFATSHPKDLTDETIATMAETQACLDYLHLPFQSGSNRILKEMNRVYSREQYLELVEKVKRAMPGISLSTDIIVGFPGETEEDFEDTLSLYDACEFDQAFTFIYSPREGTPAATMPDQIPDDVSQERFQRLVARVQKYAYEDNQKTLNTLQSVLIEGTSKRDESKLVARSRQNKVVHFPVPSNYTVDELVGRIALVRITDAQTWFIAGEFDSLEDDAK